MAEQPVCFITGGASGIGAACVRRFAQAGYRVGFGDVQLDKGRGLANAIGAGALFVPLDVRHESEFAAAVQAVIARFGRLDCLVNNAAISGVLGPIAQVPMEEYDYTCAVVQRSVFIGTQLAAQVMQPQRSGAIVNIASIAGITGGAGPHVYSACKAAVIALTQSVALELAESGIRVNAVAPGNIETPIHTGVTDERWTTRMARIRPLHADDQAIDRMGQPEEIAHAVAWLASDAASYVTGHTLVVDGGFTAGRPWRKQPGHWRELHRTKRGSAQ